MIIELEQLLESQEKVVRDTERNKESKESRKEKNAKCFIQDTNYEQILLIIKIFAL